MSMAMISVTGMNLELLSYTIEPLGSFAYLSAILMGQIPVPMPRSRIFGGGSDPRVYM